MCLSPAIKFKFLKSDHLWNNLPRYTKASPSPPSIKTCRLYSEKAHSAYQQVCPLCQILVSMLQELSWRPMSFLQFIFTVGRPAPRYSTSRKSTKTNNKFKLSYFPVAVYLELLTSGNWFAANASHSNSFQCINLRSYSLQKGDRSATLR